MTLWPPLGLLYLASSLRHRLDVEVILVDRNQLLGEYGDPTEVDQQTVREIAALEPDWIGISATTLLMSDAAHVASLARRASPEARIVLGGVHPSALAEETLSECPEAELAVVGEGEETLVELVGGGESAKVRGVVYRDGRSVRRTHQRPPCRNLDSIPQPAWDLAKMGYYNKSSDRVIRGRILKATHLVSSRGCPFSCRFCAGAAFFPGVRYFSPPRVISDVEYLMNRLAIEGLYFADDMFASDAARALEICKLMVERGNP